MPVTLLPASAAAFAPRGTPNVVLNSKVEPWLTATLKRINRIKRPLNNVSQHHRCLTGTLSATTAIWTLCSIMLSKAPDSELRRDDNPLVEALFNYQLLHIEAYVVHVDMVSQNEVAFKLTQETIEALIEYHKDIFSIDTSASTWNWSEKETQLKKLQEDFVQAVNKFVFRTTAVSLEGLEEDGSGELLSGGAEEVKNQIMGLFLPLLPPPPRVPEIVRPAAILPSSHIGAEAWWPSAMQHSYSQESYQTLPSSPSTTSSIDSHPNPWTSMGVGDLHFSSPEPMFNQPYTTAGPDPCYADAPDFYSMPMSCGSMTCTSMTCEPLFASMPLPSVLAQQCGTTAGFGGLGGYGAFGGFNGLGGFGWDSQYAVPYAAM